MLSATLSVLRESERQVSRALSTETMQIFELESWKERRSLLLREVGWHFMRNGKRAVHHSFDVLQGKNVPQSRLLTAQNAQSRHKVEHHGLSESSFGWKKEEHTQALWVPSEEVRLKYQHCLPGQGFGARGAPPGPCVGGLYLKGFVFGAMRHQEDARRAIQRVPRQHGQI